MKKITIIFATFVAIAAITSCGTTSQISNAGYDDYGYIIEGAKKDTTITQTTVTERRKKIVVKNYHAGSSGYGYNQVGYGYGYNGGYGYNQGYQQVPLNTVINGFAVITHTSVWNQNLHQCQLMHPVGRAGNGETVWQTTCGGKYPNLPSVPF